MAFVPFGAVIVRSEDSKVGGLGNLRREMLACFRNRLKDVTASASYLSHYLFNPKTPASLVQKLPLLNAVIEGLQEVKGKRITVLDLRHIPHAVAGWFVIAHGTSRTQVEALAQSVESTTADKAAENLGANKACAMENGRFWTTVTWWCMFFMKKPATVMHWKNYGATRTLRPLTKFD